MCGMSQKVLVNYNLTRLRSLVYDISYILVEDCTGYAWDMQDKKPSF